MSVKNIYPTEQTCPIPYTQFRKHFKQAIKEFLSQHGNKRDQDYFKRQGDSLCKRLYTHIGPLISRVIKQKQQKGVKRALEQQKRETPRGISRMIKQ